MAHQIKNCCSLTSRMGTNSVEKHPAFGSILPHHCAALVRTDTRGVDIDKISSTLTPSLKLSQVMQPQSLLFYPAQETSP